LAQDQLAELQDLANRLDDGFGVFTYDGDTPSDARKAIRERGHIVLTNPDMLHTGILPHHTKWMRLFENLRYIVLDELHTYRGVFSEPLYRACETLLNRTLELISACPCENGCPSCVGPTADRGERTKEVALEILARVCGDTQFVVTQTAETA